MNKLRIAFNTGLAWVKTIEVEGTMQDDLLGLIEEYIEENPQELRRYTYEELMEIYEDEEEVDRFIPINGGEFYIDWVENVEEWNGEEWIKAK